MELACATGQPPHEVAHWPWRRVQRSWEFLQRKQRRDQRLQLLMAQQSGMGALSGAFGGGGGGSAPVGGDGDMDLRQAAAMGIPVKVVKTGD